MSETSPVPIPLHGGQLRQIAARFGLSPKALLDFSANINPAGPPPSVLSAITHALVDPETLTTYPDLELTDLKQAIASHIDVHPENIVVANGFVPLLDATLRSLNIKRCLLPVPAFNEYRRTLERAKVEVTPYPLSPAFSYDPEAISKALKSNHCDALLLANPQNPSGALCESEQMVRLMEMTAKRSVTLLLDEAFIDYCPTHSLTRRAADQEHVVAFRSVTKFFAIPGLRIAYAVCNISHAANFSRLIPPWPVTTLASHAVCAALMDHNYSKESRLANHRRRLWLEQKLRDLEIETYRSEANFLLLRFPAKVNIHSLWEKMIVNHHIVLRSCANFEGLESEHLRIAVKSEEENEKLIAGLRRALS